MSWKRVFIHGLEGSSQGNKARLLRSHFPDILTPDFTGSVAERMHQLESLLAADNDLVLIGSSLGGLMAAMYTCQHPHRVRRLVLLAPALVHPAFAPFRNCCVAVPTCIYHGTRDDVVPLDPVRTIASQVFTSLTFHVVEDDHRLAHTVQTLPWQTIV
jgi:pimeloyl-ACP methyl ester carboxylesterase